MNAMQPYLCKPFCAGLLIFLLATFSLVSSVGATERRFTYVYEASTADRGEVEIENWVTWKTHPSDNAQFSQVDFRHELEFGVTDRLQASIYLADWSYVEDPQNRQHGARYTDSALEFIYRLTSPVTNLLGSAIYGEVRGGDQLLELEGKIILQKNIGRFAWAYNATFEAIWEGEKLGERSGEFSQSVGVSYEITPALFVGVEGLHEIDLPNRAHSGPSIVYGGPNVSYRHANWYVTLTPLAQLTGVHEEVSFQTRMIFGVEF